MGNPFWKIAFIGCIEAHGKVELLAEIENGAGETSSTVSETGDSPLFTG
jgi:hypothetical protein